MISGKGKENVDTLALVSLKPQQELGTDFMASRESMILDIAMQEKMWNGSEEKSGSEVVNHAIIPEYESRSSLQDCTNANV